MTSKYKWYLSPKDIHVLFFHSFSLQWFSISTIILFLLHSFPFTNDYIFLSLSHKKIINTTNSNATSFNCNEMLLLCLVKQKAFGSKLGPKMSQEEPSPTENSKRPIIQFSKITKKPYPRNTTYKVETKKQKRKNTKETKPICHPPPFVWGT